MIYKITKAYTRRYSDTGQTKTYVEWVDFQGRSGRTEGRAYPVGLHMQALLDRAVREHVPHTHEVW